MAADDAPGVPLCIRKIKKEDPSLVDLTPTVLALFNMKAAPETVRRGIFS